MATKTEKQKEALKDGLNSIDKSIINLEKFAQQTQNYMDKAGKAGDTVRVKSLIKQKIGIDKLLKQIYSLRDRVKFGACTAQTLSELGKLPKAISSCKGLLKESPNFASLGKNIQSIFKDMNKTQEELDKLNDLLGFGQTETLESRLIGFDDIEESPEYKAEQLAMLERIGKPDVIRPKSSVTIDDGVFDISGIIDELKNEKP